MAGERVARTAADLREALSEQVTLLRLSSRNFDDGEVLAGKQLAATLRTLLFEPVIRKGNRTSPLLHQLGLIRHRFLDTANSIDPARLSILFKDPVTGHIPSCGLVDVQFSEHGAAFYAPLDEREPGEWPSTPYAEWWTRKVLRDVGGATASRLDLVKHVASTDGGAHVDAALDVAYANWKSGITLGWATRRGDEQPKRLPNLELHCMRQMAHEVLRTLAGAAAWAFAAPYAYPARPPEGANRLSQGVVLAGNAEMAREGADWVLTSTA
jgi:hypothetical protein